MQYIEEVCSSSDLGSRGQFSVEDMMRDGQETLLPRLKRDFGDQVGLPLEISNYLATHTVISSIMGSDRSFLSCMDSPASPSKLSVCLTHIGHVNTDTH
jgi:hypothetical protein